MKKVILLTQIFMFLNYTYGSKRVVRIVPADGYFESRGSVYSNDLDEASKFLNHFDVKADDLMNMNGLANWRYETDLTDANLQKTVEVGMEVSEFFLRSSENATQLKTLDLPSAIHRQISLIRRSADPTSDAMRSEIKETIGKMTSIFGKTKIYDSSSQRNLTLSDLSDILKTSRDSNRLKWVWQSWRDKIGPEMKEYYSNLVDLLNVGAREHGWIDYGDYLRSDYEMGDDLIISLDKVWKSIEPLYAELHAYVRYKLHKKYKRFKKDGLVPASLFGDMFSQNWINIFDLVKPCKKSKTFDVTNELKKQNYTVKKMFELAESFFTSLGLSKMPVSFWNNSVLEKLSNKEMVCHASAWDVSKTDVRIKMCSKVNQEDLTTIHHEMGHIEYFLAYQNQPNTFRAGANPGFHEAIGDTISLSVESPNYLHRIGLMKSNTLSKDDTISFLLNQALRRVAPLPYNFLVDKWRWRVFEGNITDNNYNFEWWKLRAKYQGVKPPAIRQANAFDPASKYHIGANVPYIAYFVSYVLQFELHKALCLESKHNGPLHECSIYKSNEAGKKLKTMLEAGRSEPWSMILKRVTGYGELKADSILEYFQPLKKWLEEQRGKKNYPIGWKEEDLSQVLQKKTKRYELGQERSGILKTNSGDVSLSINIPSVTLNDLISKKTEASREENDIMKESLQNSTHYANSKNDSTRVVQPTAIDLAKLIASGSPLSIKTSETTASNKAGSTEINQKQLDINSMGENIKQNKNEEKISESKQSQLGGLSNSTLAIIQQLLAGKSKSNSAKDLTGDNILFKNVSNVKALPTVSVPLAANLKPDNDFPVVAAAVPESKENPKSAGINKEQINPMTAGISPEPKPNPVPSNQIALLPVALPSSLITALQKAFNGTNKNNSNHNNVDLSSLKALVNSSLDQNQNVTSTVETPFVSNSTQSQFGVEVSNTSSVTPTYANTSSNEVGAEVSTDIPANQTNIANGTYNALLDSLQEQSPFTSTQTVQPCKKDGSDCLQGKVITEGNSVPNTNSVFDDTRKTVSVSPSLLIQKLIEHHVADKSTPDPVVNAIPGFLKKNNTQGTVSSNESENSKGSASEVDIGKIIKALTGTKTLSSNEISNETAVTNANQTIVSIKKPDAGVSEQTSNEKTSIIENLKNCSELMKRGGVSLNFNCNTPQKNHKGGSLSISPSELVQRLLETKAKNEVNRKTIPSARVVKTPNGFLLNFDLNTKDNIPEEYNTKQQSPIGRQQHVDVYNTPKGMVVKPKSSVQLLTPQFVPVQSKDHLELGKQEG